MDARDETPSDIPPPRRETMRVPAWIALVLLALVIAAVVWRQLSVTSAERRLETERQELTQRHESERKASADRARDALQQHSDESLRLFGTALGWTVRSALLRNNRDEIDQYFTELVKDARVRLALLATPDGKILVSSDRNFQGAAFSQHFPEPLLQETNVTIHFGEGQLRRLVIPVHGLSAPLGTVLVVYEAPTLPQS